MKKMRIRIGRDGKTTVAVEGVAGPSCLEFTKLVEQAVGAVEKRVHTEDFNQEEQENLASLIEEERL